MHINRYRYSAHDPVGRRFYGRARSVGSIGKINRRVVFICGDSGAINQADECIDLTRILDNESKNVIGYPTVDSTRKL
jgi:hypothetical protein